METGKHVEWDRRIGVPTVVLRNGGDVGPGTGPFPPDALRVRTKMTSASETIAAMSARDVPFADDEIAFRKTFHVIAGKIDNSNKFVSDGHRHGNRLLRPRVPVVNVDVRSTDRCLQNADENVVAADFWNWNCFEPKSRLGLSLNDGLHRLLHKSKLSTDFTDSHGFVRNGNPRNSA